METPKRRGRPPNVPSTEVQVLTPVNLDTLDVHSEAPEQVTYDTVAYSMVKHGKLYKLVRLQMNSETYQTGAAEEVFASTDRWETQNQFDYELESSFMMRDDL